MVEIKRLIKPRASALQDVNALMGKISLSRTPPRPMTMKFLKEMLTQHNLYFLTANSGNSRKNKIIGIISLYFVYIPSGLTAVLEDLIVDKLYHKWGIGRLLVEKAIDIAREKRARHISLRTNPKRIEANKLYNAMSFHQMKTNFYRINLFK